MVRRFLLGLLVAALASPDMAKARCSSLEPVPLPLQWEYLHHQQFEKLPHVTDVRSSGTCTQDTGHPTYGHRFKCSTAASLGSGSTMYYGDCAIRDGGHSRREMSC